MLFRNQYWRGAVAMMRDQGWLGVGANNFGRFFPRYKPVECPEDVESPHSWVVQAATEWGALGLVGLVIVFVGVSRQIARGASFQEPSALAQEPPAKAGSSRANAGSVYAGVGDSHADGGSVVLWMGGIGVIAIGALGWSLAGTDPWFWATSMLVAVVPWLVGFLAASIESTDSTRFADDVPGPVLAGLCAGMIGFLIHTGVDLAMFRPSAATTFFALMAAALALRECGSSRSTPSESKSPRPWPGGTAESEYGTQAGATPWPGPWAREGRPGTLGRRIAAVAIGIGGVAVAAWIIGGLAVPAWRLGQYLQTARVESKPSPWQEYEKSPEFLAYQRAVECYRLDGAAVDELIEELIPRVAGVPQVDAVLGLVEGMLQRDPANTSVWHHRAVLYYQRYLFGRTAAEREGNTEMLQQAVADLERAVTCMRLAVAGIPSLPSQRMNLGDLLAQQAEVTDSADAQRAAVAELRKALDLDDQRIYVSGPHRMSKEMRARVEKWIEGLMGKEGTAGPTGG